jgi:uncharacterized protein (DUF1810 family)
MHADLDRFVRAQDPVWDQVLAELRAGHKTSHWMWFVFPQLAGLGHSEMAQRYAIASLAEARAYLVHPVLGRRLEEAARLLLDHRDRPADEIMGPIDALKLRSCMTVFLRADPRRPTFQAVLDAFHGGIPDARTDALLAGS